MGTSPQIVIAVLLGMVAVGIAGFAWRFRRRRHPALGEGLGLGSAGGFGGGPASSSRPAGTLDPMPSSVRRLVAAAKDEAGGEGRASLGLQGNLAQTPLHDLLQYLSLGRKSGTLELVSGRRTGRIIVCEGKVGKTEYRGKEGMEAAFLMLDLAEGDFEFFDRLEDPPGDEASLDVVDLIMMWMAAKPRTGQASKG